MGDRHNYIYKNGPKTILINFRPSTLLKSIYKRWATIIANRLTPIMNMLTDERQHAYINPTNQPLTSYAT